MTSISLASYFLSVCKTGDRESLRLDRFGANNSDLFALANQSLDRLAEWPYQDAEARKLLRLRDAPQVDQQQRRIEGLLESGEFGYETSLLDAECFDLKYERQVLDAELLPLYFLLEFPQRKKKGFAILQRFGSHGAKGALESILTADLPKGYSLHWSPAIPFEVVEKWTHVNRAKTVRFIQHQLPRDWCDAIGLEKPEEVSAEIVLRAKPRRSFRIPGSRTRLPDDFVELQDLWPHDQIKIQADIDGRTRTFDTREPGSSMRAFCDITDDVEWGEDGHPSTDSLRLQAVSLLTALEGTQMVRPGQATSPRSRKLAQNWLVEWQEVRL